MTRNPRLQLFAIRTSEIAERVYSGKLPFIEGVDLAYDVAVASGLEAEIGADDVQKIMAAAFASAAASEVAQ
jgi:hypothetical protein